MNHWVVFYKYKSGRVYNKRFDVETAEEAKALCQKAKGFQDFYRDNNGEPIVKREYLKGEEAPV